MDINAFADRIRKLRGNRSQREVAGCIGTTQQSLGRYESGKRKPDLEIIEKLSRYYSVSADYLLGLDEDPSPNHDMDVACSVTGLQPQTIDVLLRLRMDPELAGIDELLDYAVGNLTEDLIGLIQKAHNLTMDRFYDRQKVLKQFNAEKGLSLSSLLLSFDLYDYTEADNQGLKGYYQEFNEYYKKVVLERCQEELKKPDKITVETAIEFEKKCKQYAEYQLHRADNMRELAMRELLAYIEKVRKALLDGCEYFGGPVDQIIQIYQQNHVFE